MDLTSRRTDQLAESRDRVLAGDQPMSAAADTSPRGLHSVPTAEVVPTGSDLAGWIGPFVDDVEPEKMSVHVTCYRVSGVAAFGSDGHLDAVHRPGDVVVGGAEVDYHLQFRQLTPATERVVPVSPSEFQLGPPPGHDAIPGLAAEDDKLRAQPFLARTDLVRFTTSDGAEQWLGSRDGGPWETWDDRRVDHPGEVSEVLDPGAFEPADPDQLRLGPSSLYQGLVAAAEARSPEVVDDEGVDLNRLIDVVEELGVDEQTAVALITHEPLDAATERQVRTAIGDQRVDLPGGHGHPPAAPTPNSGHEVQRQPQTELPRPSMGLEL